MPYRKHLNKDKILKKLIAAHEPVTLEKRNAVLVQLCKSIMSQQLSTKVAAVIYGRFANLFEGKKPKPQDIADMSIEKLRSIGLSNAKAMYIKNVGVFFLEHKLTDAKLHKMANEEIIDLLTQIKGVGRWTVEMLLMFTFAREDVFSPDDYGIQKAMIKLYNLETDDKKAFREKIKAISDAWSPYRTYACRHLWKSLA